MKFLLEQVARYFDEYSEGVNKAWLDEYNRVVNLKSEGKTAKFEVAKVMDSQPKISLEKFTAMFTEATERIEIKYKKAKPDKNGLFAKKQ